MAFADDLQNFLETRLQAFQPTIDLSAGSPAQLQIIQPTIARFAEDPLSTDISEFIRDRLTQEYPDLVSDNASLYDDIFSKPLQMLLEPFKREIQTTKINQSVNNASLMSEDEVDALAANWFESRDPGDFAGGSVRLYFNAPTTSRVTTDRRLFTASGLSFYPTQNYFITSAQMLFNRQGNFYFLDIVVRAEAAGDQYNIAKGDIVGIENVGGVVKVANLSDFTTGAPRETNDEFLSRLPTALTERSLVTARGIQARVPGIFESVRALQIVGAGEEGMNRDILQGTGEGFLHIAGKGTIYGQWLWANDVQYRDDGTDNSIIPQAGDTIRFHLGNPAPSTTVTVTATITNVLVASGGKYLFLLDSSPYGSGVITVGSYALFKPGYITISKIPGGIASSVQVPDNTIHLGGHADVFVRPNSDTELQGVLEDVTDESPLIAIVDLTVPTANQNRVYSAATDFVAAETKIGDTLVIETGSGFAGTYRILEVEASPNQNYLRVDALFSSATGAGVALRARVVRNITVDLVEPRIPKLPFTPGPVSDLSTTVGSTEFKFASIDIQSFGAKVGDTIKVIDGPDAGTFTIQGFNFTGSALVDRVATSTGSGLRYEVYTALAGLELPLVRLKSIEVLDSTNQTTGITVPYGDAVDIRPTCDLEGAGKEKITYDKQLIIFPDMEGLWGTPTSTILPADPITGGSINSTTDARYTQQIETADGVIRTVTHNAGNPILESEINVPPFVWNGKRDKLLALVTENDTNFVGTGTAKTSDLAEAKIGDSINIYDGPNQGLYIIKDLRVLELWGKSDVGHRKVALIQVDPEFKVDPIRSALDFIKDYHSGTLPWTASQLFGFLGYAADWDNGSGFYTTFLTQLRSDLNANGVSFADVPTLKTFFDVLIRTSYSTGPSSRGDFRLYFTDPVSIELNFDTNPTLFKSAVDGLKTLRLSPFLEPAQIFPEAATPTPPTLWNRNLGVKYPPSTTAYLTSGSALALRGVQVGDVVEFAPAINDLPARGTMASSWLCTTQLGSNVVQLILPPNTALDNYTTVVAGQLLFIDSGPDLGAYNITEVVTQDWVSNPPVIKVRIEKALSSTTDNYPGTGEVDFASVTKPVLLTTALSFPLPGAVTGTTLTIGISTNSGTSFPTTKTHTFGAGPFNSVADILSDITGAGTLTAGGLLQAFDAGGGILGIRGTTGGPAQHLRVEASSTSLTHGIAYTSLQRAQGYVGARALSGASRLYGSGLSVFSVGNYLSVYAAQNPVSGGTDSVLTAGDDTAYLGTFNVVAAGTETTGEQTGENYIELDRGAPFPTNAQVRWVKLQEAPTTTPADTTGGGREISDQFVRFRMYDHTPKKLAVTAIPWTGFTTTHPLLTTSQDQVTLASPGIIDTGSGQKNFGHMDPYRILRDGVLRVSATAMATQRDGALYYVDVPVLGIGPGEELNVQETEGFVLAGSYKVEGYTLEVDDENFVFSSKERVNLILPNSVLPVGSTPDLENAFNLAGQNIQITYNNASLVNDLQRFFDSPLDRVTVANLLARHFLPAYVMLDASYTGGDTEDVVAAAIINYINNIDPSVAEIRSDLVEDEIKGLGATKVQLPITLIALVHGTDRRIRGMRSATAIGITDLPLFKGTFKQTYFISGPDTSKSTTRPNGEQIFLRRT